MISRCGQMKTSSSKEYFLMKFSASCVGRVNTLFTNSILPELMRKWFSRPPTPTAALDNCQKDERYCYCRGPDIQDMVGCDNAECSYKWFLLSCLKLRTFLKSSIWYCPECCKMRKQKHTKPIPIGNCDIHATS